MMAPFLFLATHVLLFFNNNFADGFVVPYSHSILKESQLLFQATAVSKEESSSSTTTTTIDYYRHKDWKLTYRYSRPKEKSSSLLLLIHPVGIGLNSWFWDKVISTWQSTSTSPTTIVAPDLIGCGTQYGGDAWNPSEQGLSFPLGWVEGVEALFPTIFEEESVKDCTLVVQGGLAPVGVLLAKRNPNCITRLVLTSPPTWKEMITDFPSSELQRNYKFLTNPWSANPAFALLEQESLIRFFSNAFLFSDTCDDEWMKNTQRATSREMRLPVAAFNAGLVNHRSFYDELTANDLQETPTLVLTGCDDKRDRSEYPQMMKYCQWKQLRNCCNVLPWESPTEFCNALQDFISNSEEEKRNQKQT